MRLKIAVSVVRSRPWAPKLRFCAPDCDFVRRHRARPDRRGRHVGLRRRTLPLVEPILDWATMTHNPYVDVTKETTTLYASDRDVFLFLVDDTHPIEAGRLPNGDPDLYFRGFYCWNSEVGSKTLGIASFYLRAVCMNRNLWGVEDFQEISIRHSKFATQRFAHEAAPALTNIFHFFFPSILFSSHVG